MDARCPRSLAVTLQGTPVSCQCSVPKNTSDLHMVHNFKMPQYRNELLVPIHTDKVKFCECIKCSNIFNKLINCS